MATRVQIDCVNKNPRDDPYHAIKSVGGPNPDGTRWKLSLADAIAGDERGEWKFYVHQGTHTVDVVVAVSPHGHKYLKTVADRDKPDNLLSLKECP
jgi:hypothetical protein